MSMLEAAEARAREHAERKAAAREATKQKADPERFARAARARWAKTSDEQRLAHAARMSEAAKKARLAQVPADDLVRRIEKAHAKLNALLDERDRRLTAES